MVSYMRWQACASKKFRREVIHYVNVEDQVTYKCIEWSLGLNHDEELQVNASILGATKVWRICIGTSICTKNMFYLGLSLDSLDGWNYVSSYSNFIIWI